MAQAPREVRCLQEWDKYPPFQRRAAFFKRFWSVLAIGPFFVVLVVIFQYFSTSASKLLLALVFAALVWAVAVSAYAAFLNFRGIDCPKCGARFGRGAKCGSCGLPRALPAKTK